MSKLESNIKIIKKQEFTTNDGREWICALDGNKPMGQVQVTYNLNDKKFVYNGTWEGNLEEGYFNGYGVLNRSDGFILKGIFKKGQFKKGKKIYGPNSDYKSFEGEIKIDENNIIKKYSGITPLIEGTLIWKKYDKKYTGTFSNNDSSNYSSNFNEGSYEWKDNGTSYLHRGTFHNSSDCVLKEGHKDIKYTVDKDEEYSRKNLKEILDGTYDEDGDIITGEKNIYEKKREWTYYWKDQKIINMRLTFLNGEYEKSTLEGQWEEYKLKKWEDGKNVEINSNKTGFKKGTKIIYKKHGDNDPKKFLKLTGVFDHNNNNYLCCKNCIEGDIEYTDIYDKYFVKGKIKNSKFSEGEILFNNIKVKSIKGKFNGFKNFMEGTITYNNSSFIKGLFEYNFKNNYYRARGGKIIEGTGIFFVSPENSNDEWYKDFVFVTSIESLVKKMIKNKKLFPVTKINYCKQKLGIINQKTSGNYPFKILFLSGKWKNNEFIKGEIKYTFLDGNDHLIYFNNGVMKKIKEVPKNPVNKVTNDISKKRSSSDILIKSEVKKSKT